MWKKNNKKWRRWWTKFAIIESLYNTNGVNWITLSPRLYQTCADWGRFTGCVVLSLFIISSFSSNRTFERLSIWKRIFKENQRNASPTADTVEDCLTIKKQEENFFRSDIHMGLHARAFEMSILTKGPLNNFDKKIQTNE